MSDLRPAMKRRLIVVAVGLVVLAACAGWLVISQLLRPSAADPSGNPRTAAVSAAAREWSLQARGGTPAEQVFVHAVWDRCATATVTYPPTTAGAKDAHLVLQSAGADAPWTVAVEAQQVVDRDEIHDEAECLEAARAR